MVDRSHDQYLIAGLAQNPQSLRTGGQFEIRPSPLTVLRLSRIQAPAVVLVGESDIADVIAYAGAAIREYWLAERFRLSCRFHH
jgi:hypothetical protein